MCEEKKIVICCGTTEENLCEGISCKVEKTGNGFTISVTSDDPERLSKLRAKMESCFEGGDSGSCC